MLTETSPELLAFLTALQKLIPVPIYASMGVRYARIVRNTQQPTALCFIALANGNVYRAAKWDDPKLAHIRGNIYDADHGLSQMTPEGLTALKCGKPKGFKHDVVVPRPNRAKAIPKDKKGPAPHRPGVVTKKTGPMIEVPPLAEVKKGIAVTHGILPVRIFTPKR